MLQEFLDDDAGYSAWIRANPRGFVINCDRKPTAYFCILHRVRCLQKLPPRTGDYQKVCAPTVDELDMWAFNTVGDTPTRCEICHPS
jgi:hypothetical protein